MGQTFRHAERHSRPPDHAAGPDARPAATEGHHTPRRPSIGRPRPPLPHLASRDGALTKRSADTPGPDRPPRRLGVLALAARRSSHQRARLDRPRPCRACPYMPHGTRHGPVPWDASSGRLGGEPVGPTEEEGDRSDSLQDEHHQRHAYEAHVQPAVGRAPVPERVQVVLHRLRYMPRPISREPRKQPATAPLLPVCNHARQPPLPDYEAEGFL